MSSLDVLHVCLMINKTRDIGDHITTGYSKQIDHIFSMICTLIDHRGDIIKCSNPSGTANRGIGEKNVCQDINKDSLIEIFDLKQNIGVNESC